MALLDRRGWYTPDDVAALFGALERLDGSALDIYAITALTIDMLLPLSYGLLFALLLWRRLQRAPLNLTPSALALSDVLENVTVVWPDFPPGRLRQVAAATTIACGIACVWIAVLELR